MMLLVMERDESTARRSFSSESSSASCETPPCSLRSKARGCQPAVAQAPQPPQLAHLLPNSFCASRFSCSAL